MKYDSERDKILDWMGLAGWANESCGDVNAPVGHFMRMTNTEHDRDGVEDAFGEDMRACDPPVKFEDLIGHFLIRENDQGFVTVEKFDTTELLYVRWGQLYKEFDKWNSQEQEDDDGPCCYGFITSQGQVHQVGCYNFVKGQ